METYSVRQLAKLAGISVRALHYYDQIGLLKPDRRRNGYREYGRDAALCLQQILFFRELGFPLAEIREILARPDFDMREALTAHRGLLEKRVEHVKKMLATLDKTIASLKGEKDMEIKDYFEGLTDEQVEVWRKKARERWGEKAIAESEQRILSLGKEQFTAIQKEIDGVWRAVAANMDKGPDSPEVQDLVGKWRQWLETFGHYTDEMALGLGRAYSADERFANFYRKYHPDMPSFWTKAIEIYCGAAE